MPRKILAVLLVCSWVILSGFDLLEDLRSPQQLILSAASHERNSPAKIGRSGPLVNNIVESALERLRPYVVAFSSQATAFPFKGLLDFRPYLPLHKRYCVFLI
jgi:hypothetical protein